MSVEVSPRTVGSPPLTGTRVIDFGHVLAGPFGPRVLADFGADVLRVESSKHPDAPWRTRADKRFDRPAADLIVNRNKRSITIDLKAELGRDIARRLCAVADVVLENFSAGVMARLGLDYETLRLLNRGLIYVSMSGYGHTGPRASWRSMNGTLQSNSGLMLTNGAEGDPPIGVGNSWNDYVGGLHATFAILHTLQERRHTGEGRYLDLSQFECSVGTLGGSLVYSSATGSAPPRMGNRSTGAGPQGCYRCAGEDEWCTLSVQNDAQWQALTAIIERPDLSADHHLNSILGRQRQHDEIDAAIEAWSRELPPDEAERRLKAGGVPAERMRRIQTLVDVPDGATVFHRMDEPRLGSMLVTGLPMAGSINFAPLQPAPRYGEHSQDVLREWLGLSDAEIAEIARQEVLV